ncbi:MAG: ATP-binding cassette domain-containing protein [Gammaproteobacteria bacterium]|nr:ATP-binding cassette domain-containing protein [Gammaproteobacteria bacterium]MDP2139518.1 ATP-binding cassette domain-containing protein [Gammaproteobacteria bacterium]MDP2346491.1 ATP-binding cassette domain-containing protein [Gammaproteobacteria bacterium]
MLLYRLSNLSLAYGDRPLLDKVDLTIHKGERIGILGQNGAGKSTFMKLLCGQALPDSGELWRASEVRVAYLDQNLPELSEETVYDYVASGLAELGDLLRRYHAMTHTDADTIDWSDPKQLDAMAHLQKQIEARDGWAFQHRIDSIIDSLKLPADSLMRNLSGGSRRRAALGRALVCDPDMLLLDEPTNHLDIPTIEWLEKHLNSFNGAVLVISHDRQFLQRITNRIIEVDRGKLRCWEYDYESFLVFRDQQLDAEEKFNSEFDKKLAEEEKWIRTGIKARRTRNEGRVRALEQMRYERQQRRELSGKAKFELEQSSSSGKIVIEATKITHSFGGEPLIKNFSTKILRGDRIGFIGANGCGKTTLLKILLGNLQPDQGEVKVGTNLELLYFDQLRNQLDLDKTIIDNLCEGRDFIEINGKQRHVISYLQDFLFVPARMRQPVKSLSGGEQNRLILAKLFSKPANLIVLDEPTNDLDMETLELLEEILLEFSGTILLVSHDRRFLDNVVTSSIVFEGNGEVREYVGGYQDWVNQGGKLVSFADQGKEAKAEAKPVATVAPAPVAQPKESKLSYKQQQELEKIPKDIEKLEEQMAAFESVIAADGFYSQDQKIIEAKLAELAALQSKLDVLYARWEELSL